MNMESLMKADIFFFVTTVAVVAVTICLVYAGYYLIRILRNVREDLGDLRTNIREEGMKVKHFTGFFSQVMGKRAARTRARKEKEE
jgi:hypothetical protein